MLKKFAHFIIVYRYPVIIISTILTLVFLYFARNVKVSSNLMDLAPEDNKELIALKETLKTFGSSTFVMISVDAQDPFSVSTLTKLKRISDELKKLPEVEEVIDPLNAKIFKYIFGMIVVQKSLPGGEVPTTEDKIKKFKKEMLSEPILKNVVVSENGEALAIYIRLKEGINQESIRKEIIDIIKPYEGPEKFYIAGRPIIESWVKEYLTRDSVRLALPIVILVIFVLFLNFKSPRGIVLPLSIMIGSIIWTLGLMGIFNRTITMVGVMLPTLILVISSSYSIHFLNQYYKDIHSDPHKRRNIEKSIINIGRTIFLAAVTTIAGFAALTINKIRPMRELGIFVLIGVFFAMILSLSFLPAILTFLKKPKQRVYAVMEGSRMNRAFSFLGGVIVRRWKIILILAVGVGIWCIVGIKNITVDTSWERFFKKNSEILQSQRFIRSNFGGVSTLNVTFEIENPDLDFKNIEALRYIDKIEQWVKNNELFGPTLSIVDYIKRANMLIHRNKPEEYKLPETEADLLKIILMFKMSEFTKSLGNVITEDFKKANLIVRTTNAEKADKPTSMTEFKAFLDSFREFINNNRFEGIKVKITGVDIIYVSLINYLVRSQLLSIAISIIIVYFIIAYTFRSFVFGFFGLIPIIFGLFLNFGAMSYFNIPLDFITSMIASIAVGLGVDNSIHYLIRFSKTKHTLPLDERISIALVNSGIPIFFTSFTLIAGFSVLLFSTFKPILYFGLLISLTMLGCLIGVILVLPAFIYYVKPEAIIKGRVKS